MATTSRLSRAEQTSRNRELVLAAARRVFLERGYHAATLDQIAEAAGFSKGVVYSQFAGKGDLFLALLESRIAERAQENARLVEQALAAGRTGAEGITALLERAGEAATTEPAWGLLVLEFRIHAARDAGLNRRYAEAHGRTVAAAGSLVAALYDAAGEAPPMPAEDMARVMLAMGAGVELELAADPDALGGGQAAATLLHRLLTTGEGTKR
jgi:AcrR family transcriptional regulator